MLGTLTLPTHMLYIFFARVNNEINNNSLEEALLASLYVRFYVNRTWYMHQQGDTTHNSSQCHFTHFL